MKNHRPIYLFIGYSLWIGAAFSCGTWFALHHIPKTPLIRETQGTQNSPTPQARETTTSLTDLWSAQTGKATDDEFFRLIDRFRSMKSGPDRILLLKVILEEGMGRDRARTLAFLTTLKGTPDFPIALRSAVHSLARIDYGAARNLTVQELPPGLSRNSTLATALLSWGDQNPREALDHVADIPISDERALAINDLVTTFAQQDKVAALAWAKTLPLGLTRNRAIAALTDQWASASPEAITPLINGILPPVVMNECAGKLMSVWLPQSPSAALQWVASINDKSSQDIIMTSALNQWSQRDPRETAKFIDNLMESKTDMPLSSFVSTVVKNWSASDPSQAAQWLVGTNDETAKANGLSDVMITWAMQDYTSASRFVGTISNPNDRDGALAGLSVAQAQVDLPGAKQEAASIQNVQIRKRTEAILNKLSGEIDPHS